MTAAAWGSGRARDGGLDRIPLPPGAAGRLWVCGKRVVGPDPEAALARADDATTIVCLTERHELRDYPDYPGWLDAHAEHRAVWHPIPDLHAPPLTEAEEIVDDIVSRLAVDAGVIVHCAGGIGRAPTLSICVLVQLGMPVDLAMTHIRAHRPMAGPEVGAQHELVESFARIHGTTDS